MKPEYISLADAVGLTEKAECYLVRFAVDRRVNLFVLVVNRWGIELKVINENNDLAFPVTRELVLLDGEYRLHEKTVKSFLADPDNAYFGVPGHQTIESQGGKLFMLADTDAYWTSANPVKLTSQNLCFKTDDLTALIAIQKARTDTPPAAEPSKAKRDKIRSFLKDMEIHKPTLDCFAMPGEVVEFHALLECLDADFLDVPPSTFDNYRRKPDYLCKFQKTGPHPGFYECVAKKMGVNSGKYRKALSKLKAVYQAAKDRQQSGAA